MYNDIEDRNGTFIFGEDSIFSPTFEPIGLDDDNFEFDDSFRIVSPKKLYPTLFNQQQQQQQHLGSGFSPLPPLFNPESNESAISNRENYMKNIPPQHVVPAPPPPSRKYSGKKKKQKKKNVVKRRRNRISLNRDVRLCDASGVWSLSDRIFDGFDLSLHLKNRVEKATRFVPEIMYSSILYTLDIRACCEALDDIPNVLVAKVAVVDDKNKVLQKDISGKSPLIGTIKCVLNESTPGDFEGKLSFRFGDLSYSKCRSEFKISVVLFNPNEMKTPLICMISSPIRIFARRPNPSEKSKLGKRKRKIEKENNNKKRKVEKTNSNNNNNNNTTTTGLELFKNKFQFLIDLHDGMNEEEQKMATEMIAKALLFKN